MTEQVLAQDKQNDQSPRDKFSPKDVFYTGPGTLAGRYLRSFWQPVHLSNGVMPGRARAIRILGEDFTLYRGEGGEPHLVDHRCAHRGTQLSVGTVEGDSIRCLYHGWKYDASGQCAEQPGESRPFCQNIRIRSYPVRDYLGVVFAYLGDGEPPPFTRYERFEERADQVFASMTSGAFNYFQRLENSHDFVHLCFVHKQIFPKVKQRTLENVIPRVTTEECEWGMRTHRIDPDGADVISYFGMPNTNYILYGSGRKPDEGELLVIRMPVDDGNNLQFLIGWTGETQAVPSAKREATEIDLVSRERKEQERHEMVRQILEGSKNIDDAIAAYAHPDDPDLFAVEDDVAMMGQGVLWERKSEHLGGTDVGVVLMRRLWARDLSAMQAGRPLQKWHRTADMVPTLASLPRDLR